MSTLMLLGCDPVPPAARLAPLGLEQGPMVNGTDSSVGAAVALVVGDELFCSAVLITPRVLLTAAHCIDQGIPPTYVEAYFGLSYLRYPWEESVGIPATPEPTPTEGGEPVEGTSVPP